MAELKQTHIFKMKKDCRFAQGLELLQKLTMILDMKCVDTRLMNNATNIKIGSLNFNLWNQLRKKLRRNTQKKNVPKH